MAKQAMKVGTRLGLGFGAVLVLLMAVSGLGIYYMHHINAQLERIVQLNVAKLGLVQDMSEAVHIVARVTRTVVMLDDVPAMQRELEKLTAARASYDHASAELNRLPTSADGLALRQRIDAARAAARPLTDRMVALALAHKDAEATALLMSQAGPATQAWQDAMDEDTALIKRHNAEDAAAAAAAYRSARALMLTLSGLALLAGIAASTLIARRLLRQLGGEPDHAAEIAGRIASGDLTVDVATRHGDNASMMAAMKTMRDSLLDIVSEVRRGTDTIATATSQIASGNLDLSSRTEQQASALEETASSMEELTSVVRENDSHARQANALAAEASRVAQQGGAVVGEVVQTMGSISDASRRIVDIIGVIDGIAFQTNILALNAAVEAARAGEQGRGFAVVAGEVRTLAQRCAAAAREIKDLIGDSVQQVDSGSQLVQKAGRTMDEVVTSVQRVSAMVEQIAAAGREQSEGIEQINRAVSEMDSVTQQNAALVEEAAAAAESLKDQADRLSGVVGVFKVGEGGAQLTAKRTAVISAPTKPAAPNRAAAIT
ncbi:MAG TPA: methyl-accepting chemotaxis protein [Pseudoduganella sp.]